MLSPANRFGWPGPWENSSSVVAPRLGPVSMATMFCTHCPLPGSPGAGDAVSTWPADGLPQSARLVDTTWPLSVVTAPPAPFWKGSGMSTLLPLGHSSTAPMTTARPITASATTTMRAANGLNGARPVCG